VLGCAATVGEEKTARSDRIRGLDGIRAISVLLVIVSHAKTSEGWPLSCAFEGTRYYLGGLGVTVFFVLSGFLITMILLKEESRTGALDLRAFYSRRALRILPPACAYLLVLVVLDLAWRPVATWSELAASAAFVRNSYETTGRLTGHYWTLAIEEQFYIFWPAALLLLPRARRLPIVAAVLALMPFWHYEWMRINSHTHVNLWRTDLRCSGLLTGGGLAMWRVHPVGRATFERLRTRLGPTVFALAVAIIGLSVLTATLPQRGLLGFARTPVVDVAIAAMLAAVTTNPGRMMDRFLNASAVRYVGRLSYSLYLWQQLFLEGPDGVWFVRLPLSIALAFAAAIASMVLLEKPVLAWRDRRWDETRASHQAATHDLRFG
jgi:peptidoglycan/LPS O-acetylase OafA/YrhL